MSRRDSDDHSQGAAPDAIHFLVACGQRSAVADVNHDKQRAQACDKRQVLADFAGRQPVCYPDQVVLSPLTWLFESIAGGEGS